MDASLSLLDVDFTYLRESERSGGPSHMLATQLCLRLQAQLALVALPLETGELGLGA